MYKRQDQDHEYIELHNISEASLDLTNVGFSDGIGFAFEDGTSIAPGAYLLVVRNLVAFEERYGAGLPVAGSYGQSESASLSNGGENIELSLGATVIHRFEYNDRAPWPLGADGDGSALVLYQTVDNSNVNILDPLGHGEAANWRQGVSGGSPGTADPSEQFSGDLSADQDNDGLTALLEHAIGTSDSVPNESGFVVDFDGSKITFTFPRNALASDVRYTVEVSPDLQTWVAGGVLESQDADTATYVFEPEVAQNQRHFIRLRVEQVPILQQ